MPPHGKLTNDMSELVPGQCQGRGVSLAFRAEVPPGWREPPRHHRKGGFVLGCKARRKISRKIDWNWDQKLDFSWAPVPSSLRARSRRPGGEGSRAAVTCPGAGTGLTTPFLACAQWACPEPCHPNVACALWSWPSASSAPETWALLILLIVSHPTSSPWTSSEIWQTRIPLEVPPLPCSTTSGSLFILLGTAICSCVKWRKWCLTELLWRWMIVNHPVRV